MKMNPGAVLLIMTIGFCFLFLGLLLWYTLTRRLAADRARHELQLRLLQSAGSGADLIELMRSEEGRALMAAPSVPRDAPQSDARRYAIRAVKTAIVLLFLGAGMAVLAVYWKEDWIVVAVLALAGSFGLLGSAATSVWLSRRFHREG